MCTSATEVIRSSTVCLVASFPVRGWTFKIPPIFFTSFSAFSSFLNTGLPHLVTISKQGFPTSNAPDLLWQSSRDVIISFKLVSEGMVRILIDSLSAGNGARPSGPSGTMINSLP